MMAQSAAEITSNTFRIKPCILVLDRVKIDRALSYEREEIGTKVNEDGSVDSEWRTKKHYANREETDEANSIYSSIRYRLRKVCVSTDIGYVCPIKDQQLLKDTIEECQEIVDEANRRFKHCRIWFRVVCTRIESTNEEAAETLRDAIRQQTQEMRAALANFEPSKARAALKATQGFVEVIDDPGYRNALIFMRSEARDVIEEMVNLLKEFDGNVANALASSAGAKVMERANAEWSMF